MPFVQKIEKYLRENYILKASRVSGDTKGPVDFGKTIKFESLEILNEELKNKNCGRRGGKVRDQTLRKEPLCRIIQIEDSMPCEVEVETQETPKSVTIRKKYENLETEDLKVSVSSEMPINQDSENNIMDDLNSPGHVRKCGDTSMNSQNTSFVRQSQPNEAET